MIRIVAGNAGVGKSKQLIDMANTSIQRSKGHIVFVENSHKHMYDLNHSIRFISMSDYPLKDRHEFYGFICGMISEDHDIDTIYVDDLLRITHSSVEEAMILINKLKTISDHFSIHLVLSINCDCQLPDHLRAYLVA